MSLIAIGGIVLIFVLILWKIDLINAKFFVRFTEQFNKDVNNEKAKLFAKVNELAKKAGSESKLKVLEIGGGTGANFEFMEEPIHWTTIDPNEDMLTCFNKQVKELQEKHEFGGVIKVSFFCFFSKDKINEKQFQRTWLS